MPAVCNITLENDADFYRSFAYQNADGTPIDITGASFVMKLRRNAGDAIALLEIGSATGEISISDAANGLFTIMLRQTVLVEMGLGVYDQSLIIDLNDILIPIWSGNLTINAGPSR
jgi:hypothetical protein